MLNNTMNTMNCVLIVETVMFYLGFQIVGRLRSLAQEQFFLPQGGWVKQTQRLFFFQIQFVHSFTSVMHRGYENAYGVQ